MQVSTAMSWALLANARAKIVPWVNILIELANLSARSATVENFKEYKDKCSVTIASHLNHPTKGNQNVPRLNCLR
jgi:hypothetical protein